MGGEEDGEGVRTVTGGVFARGEVQGASGRHRKGNGCCCGQGEEGGREIRDLRPKKLLRVFLMTDSSKKLSYSN